MPLAVLSFSRYVGLGKATGGYPSDHVEDGRDRLVVRLNGVSERRLAAGLGAGENPCHGIVTALSYLCHYL